MKFLVDAQLPRRFVGWLAEAGHDALHTLDLSLGNRTHWIARSSRMPRARGVCGEQG